MSEQKQNHQLSVKYDPPLIESLITKGHVNAARIRDIFSVKRQARAVTLITVCLFATLFIAGLVGSVDYGRKLNPSKLSSVVSQIGNLADSINQRKTESVIPVEYLKDGITMINDSLSKDTLPEGFKIYLSDLNTVLSSKLMSPDNALYDAGWLVPSIDEDGDLYGYLFFGAIQKTIESDTDKSKTKIIPFIVAFKNETFGYAAYAVPFFTDRDGEDRNASFYVTDLKRQVNLWLIPDFIRGLIRNKDDIAKAQESGVVNIKTAIPVKQ